MINWYECSAVMPGQAHDKFFNKDLNVFTHPGFVVCYHHGDSEPLICRAFLKQGKFYIREFCNAYDDRRPEGEQECFDQYQTTYWDDDITVTHWAFLSWPENVL
jgi:hypothetical protein